MCGYEEGVIECFLVLLWLDCRLLVFGFCIFLIVFGLVRLFWFWCGGEFCELLGDRV